MNNVEISNNHDHAAYFAFFDVDGTIINIKTLLSFLRFYYCHHKSNRILGNCAYLWFSLKLFFFQKTGKKREFLNNYYYSLYAGARRHALDTLSENWFSWILKNNNLLNQKVIDELRWHQRNGAEVVFVSGSFFACLDPIAKYFNVSSIISTNLEEKDGILTGKILPPQTIGNGKAEAIKQFLHGYPDDFLRHCYAYGDHESDIPMLELVGNPVVVGANPNLLRYAYRRNCKKL